MPTTSKTSSPELSDPTASAVFRIGDVIGVEGRRIRIRVDKSKNGSHLLFRGSTLKATAVGGYVKIAKGFAEIIAQIDGESIAESRDQSYYASKRDRVDRVLNVSAVGFIDSKGNFQRGVQEMPLINNECFLLTHEELIEVLDFVGDDVALSIGTLPSEHDQPVAVGVDALFASHIGIFGNTGSGKSYTLAVLYSALLNHYSTSPEFMKSARIVLIDFNGEYVNRGTKGESSCVIADTSLKDEYKLSTERDPSKTHGKYERLPVSLTALSEPEFWTVFLEATDKTQAPLIRRALGPNGRLNDALKYKSLSSEMRLMLEAVVSGGRNSDFKDEIDRLFREIDEELDEASRPDFQKVQTEIATRLWYHTKQGSYYLLGENGEKFFPNDKAGKAEFDALYGRLSSTSLNFASDDSLSRIRMKILFQYFADVFRGRANPEHVGPLLARLSWKFPELEKVIRVSNDKILAKPLTVVSLRDVSLVMKKTLPLLFGKMLYEDHKRRKEEQDGYLNIVVDEAHTILSHDSSRETESWKDYRLETFEEITKEGRKFNVFLTIASQRPHDISDTIISQLHNYFLHRLVNELDIKAMRGAISYLNQLSFESLPILPTGQCVFSGLAAPVPVMVQISELPIANAPNNRTPRFTTKWKFPKEEAEP